ncbi:MAG: hypothetical protein Q4Q07_01855 [Tissierellia bacterium]|nr:hypothetical protein [Tissierellia bacterium]
MNKKITEQLLERIITEYRKRMKPKVFCHFTSKSNFSKTFVEKIKESGYETFGLKGDPYCHQEISSWLDTGQLMNESLKGVFIYGLDIKEALDLLEGRASGDKLLFILKCVDKYPVWIGLPDLIEPFENRSSEEARQLLLGALKQRGYHIIGWNHGNNHTKPSFEVDVTNNKCTDEKGNCQRLSKRFITLKDLKLSQGGTLEIGHQSKCTMAVEDFCRNQGIQIRRV